MVNKRPIYIHLKCNGKVRGRHCEECGKLNMSRIQREVVRMDEIDRRKGKFVAVSSMFCRTADGKRWLPDESVKKYIIENYDWLRTFHKRINVETWFKKDRRDKRYAIYEISGKMDKIKRLDI